MRLIDSHVHLDDPRFDPDREVVIQRARAAGIIAQIIPGVTESRCETARQIARQHSDIFVAYGLHPMFMVEHQADHLDALRERVAQYKPVAIGECGLDFYGGDEDKTAQIDYFQAQIEIACTHDLPLILHVRKALDQVTAILAASGHHKGVLHSFSGSEQQAKRLLDLGYHISLGGPVTYSRAKRLRRLIAALPLDAFLLESDAPDQPGSLHQGQRNEPAYLSEALATFVQLRKQTAETIAAATTQNAIKLFKLPTI